MKPSISGYQLIQGTKDEGVVMADLKGELDHLLMVKSGRVFKFYRYLKPTNGAIETKDRCESVTNSGNYF